MCGIAGLLDLRATSGDERRRTVDAMTTVMLCRGRDEQDIWHGSRVGFGHTRTSVIDPHGGRQPMTYEQDGRPVATLCYNGEIYNYRELRAQLRGRGHGFRTASDTEVLLHAYLEWGVDCVHHLHGIFAFAVWDERTQELLLVRDHMGVKPLFHARTSEGLVFGSEPKVLFEHPELTPVVGADGLRETLSQAKTPGTSVFTGLEEVKPGHYLRIGAEGVQEHRYWEITARRHEQDLEETVAHVRHMVDETVTEQLVADLPRGLLTSGGLDSSVIAAVSAPRLRADGDPARAFALTFRGYEEDFEADEVRATPDIVYARRLAEDLDLDLQEIVLTADDLADPELRTELVGRQDQPTPLGDMDASMYLLFQRVKQEVGVAMSGDTADEVFAGFVWSHRPELMNAPTFPWVAVGQLHDRTHRGLGCGLLAEDLLSGIDLAGFVADQYHDALADVPHLDGEDALQRRIREIDHMHMTRWLPALLDRGDRISMTFGLEARVPYCDPALVEYSYNIPWAIKSFDGREKSLLRAAFADRLPASILERRKSPFPVTQDTRYVELLCAQLTDVLKDPSSPVTELVDVRRALDVAADPQRLARGLGAWAERTDIEMVLNLDTWLRGDVRVAL